MKKYLWIILLLIGFIIGGTIYFYNSNQNQDPNYLANKTSLNNSINNTQ